MDSNERREAVGECERDHRASESAAQTYCSKSMSTRSGSENVSRIVAPLKGVRTKGDAFN